MWPLVISAGVAATRPATAGIVLTPAGTRLLHHMPEYKPPRATAPRQVWRVPHRLPPVNPTLAATSLNDQGYIHLLRGEYALAIDFFTRCLKLVPRNTRALYNRGTAFLLKHEDELAIADFSRALEIDPKFLVAFASRGVAYEREGKLDLARADFNSSLAFPAADDEAKREQQKAREHLAAMVPAPLPAPSPQSVGEKEQSPEGLSSAHVSEKRIALLFGNSHYAAATTLPNPARDANSIAEVLRNEDFTVTVVTDATRSQMVAALHSFQAQADQSDWALIYFSGHGMEVGGHNYLVPIDAQLVSDRDVDDEAVTLDRIEAAVSGASKIRLVLLDACRNNPFLAHMEQASGAKRSLERGLKPVEPVAGTLVVFATRQGETADDGDRDHSPFTTALLLELRKQGLEVRRLFDFVRDDVLDSTSGHQSPFSYGSLPAREDFYFLPRPQ
jgi:hypothetical protein